MSYTLEKIGFVCQYMTFYVMLNDYSRMSPEPIDLPTVVKPIGKNQVNGQKLLKQAAFER